MNDFSLQDEVGVYDPRDGEWDSLVATHPESSVFHSSAWARVLMDTYGHKPFYLSMSGISGKLAAAIPMMEVASRFTGRRGVSLPFSDFCGPLSSSDHFPAPISERLTALARERSWKHLEIRGGQPFPGLGSVPSFFAHILNLRVGLDKLRENVTSAVRRNLRKAERTGIKVRVGQGREEILQFYRLHVRTRRRHGLPPQSVKFFSHLYEHLIKTGLGFVVLAAAQSRQVAGAVFLRSGSRAVYKFGASDERMQQSRANNLVMWEGIKFLTEGGGDTLHFGRTSLNNEGLRRFKVAWGSREETLVYSRLDPETGEWQTPIPKSDGIAQHIFRRLPLGMNQMIGTLCYPHLD